MPFITGISGDICVIRGTGIENNYHGIGNYTVFPPLTLDSARLNLTGSHEVDLFLADTLTPNVLYTLTVSNIEDCPQNAIEDNNTAQFGILLPIEKGDIVLNEILFNPLTGGADYIELYNQSDKLLDLSTMYVGEVYFEDDVFASGDSIIVPHFKIIFNLIARADL